jgi:hypothetical protein
MDGFFVAKLKKYANGPKQTTKDDHSEFNNNNNIHNIHNNDNKDENKVSISNSNQNNNGKGTVSLNPIHFLQSF